MTFRDELSEPQKDVVDLVSCGLVMLYRLEGKQDHPAAMVLNMLVESELTPSGLRESIKRLCSTAGILDLFDGERLEAEIQRRTNQ